MVRSSIAAFALAHAIAAGADTCSVGDAEECLQIVNDDGDALCAWLVLDGKCVPAGDSSVAASGPGCCASAAPGVDCASRDNEDLRREGVCRLPGQVLNGPPSLDDMIRHLHLAGAAYCISGDEWSCGYHCDPVSGISDVKAFSTANNLHGYAAYDSVLGAIILAFRGTDRSSVLNWATNLDAVKKHPIPQYPQAGVHAGFWDAWSGLKGGALSALQALQSKFGTSTVRVVGHSLGGAIAQNAALDLALNNGFSTSALTYGTPRTGDSEFHKALRLNVPFNWRVTHHNDLVVHVPMQRLGFYHTSTEIHFPEAVGVDHKVCDGSGEDSSCANSCTWFVGGVCTSIDDHLNYLDLDCCSCAASAATHANGTSIVVV